MAGAALRSQCDFEYITEGVDPVQILLPDVQQLRSYGRFLAARSRCQMLVGDYAAAVGTLRDGMALARHTAEGPFIVHDLVGVAIARMIFARAQELVAPPFAPNLYWAFSAFPEPTIDIRSALEFESTILAMRFPELDQLDRLRSPEQWQLLRSEIATWANDLRKWNAGSDSGGGQANDPASDTERIAAAREDLTDRYGYSEDQVQNMSDAEVAVRHTVHLSREVSDEIYAISCVPFWETGPLFEHLENSVEPRFRDREGYPAVYQALMISAKAILQAPATLEEQRRALTVVEALRMHAAATGELPQALSDVQVVPVPNSYYTNEPFHYELSDGVATLTSDAPEGVAQAVAIEGGIRLRE